MTSTPTSEATRNAAAMKVAKARTRLLQERPFWGSLSMRLRVEECCDAETCPTFQTNGTILRYNPDFVMSLTDLETMGVWAHEVMHCALLHPYRCDGRDMAEWNIATDYVINAKLISEGFTLPRGILYDSQFAELSAEQVYSKRGSRGKDKDGTGQPGKDGKGTKDSPTGEFQPGDKGDKDGKGAKGQGPNQPGDGEPQPGDGNGNGDTGQPVATGNTEQDWVIATEQATAVASKWGDVPGNIARDIRAQHQPTVDWREVLKQFVQQITPSDYSWLKPNKRYIWQGIYLPGIVKDGCPRIAVAIDTSGSISPSMLEAFGSELRAILSEVKPEAIDVLYCDTAVRKIETFTPDQADDCKLRMYGGGGTRFQPVFDAVAKSQLDEQPACLIYFTDLEGPQPGQPDYPVLWIVPEWVKRVGWFGETVRVCHGTY